MELKEREVERQLLASEAIDQGTNHLTCEDGGRVDHDNIITWSIRYAVVQISFKCVPKGLVWGEMGCQGDNVKMWGTETGKMAQLLSSLLRRELNSNV